MDKKAIDPKINAIEGASYVTICEPGKTGLKFDRGKELKSYYTGQVSIVIVIDDAKVLGDKLYITWTVERAQDIWWLPSPNVSDGVLLVRNHFESKNIDTSLSVIRTELLTEGAMASRTPLDVLKDAAPDLNKAIPDFADLSKKLGIALMIFAVALAIYLGYRAMGSQTNG